MKTQHANKTNRTTTNKTMNKKLGAKLRFAHLTRNFWGVGPSSSAIGFSALRPAKPWTRCGAYSVFTEDKNEALKKGRYLTWIRARKIRFRKLKESERLMRLSDLLDLQFGFQSPVSFIFGDVHGGRTNPPPLKHFRCTSRKHTSHA